LASVPFPQSGPRPAQAPGYDPGSLPDARKFAIFGVMAFGQFMALIDIQIVAASLNEVQAGL
jgi:MFS transporter, DHA2 family, multidrug resistance protein